MDKCFKCNRPTEQSNKRLCCSGCKFWIRKCYCSWKESEPVEEITQARSRIANITGKFKKVNKMDTSKFWDTIKYLFDWDDSTKLMVFGVMAVLGMSFGGLQCRKYNVIADTLKTNQTINEQNTNTEIKKAKYQAISECVSSGRPTLECKSLMENQ
ncbi:MAG TPA: hypothetical protein VKR58_07195 [Aquella sp.]|nr:hypothetical protein [Aquella sp.]